MQMQASQLQGPWLFTTTHTGVPLAGDVCVTCVYRYTRVRTGRALAPKGEGPQSLSNTHLL